MRSHLKVLLITGTLITASLAAASATTAATAATAPPVMDTSVFACSNGVCEVGPGQRRNAVRRGAEHHDWHHSQPERGEVQPGRLDDDHQRLAAAGPAAVAAGFGMDHHYRHAHKGRDLPLHRPVHPGHRRARRDPEAHHHHRHRQLRPAGDHLGPSTRGTSSGCTSTGDDVNIRAQYSVVLTSTGKVLIPAQANTSTWDDGLLAPSAHINDPCGAENSCDITLKDSLGSSVTIPPPPAKY